MDKGLQTSPKTPSSATTSSSSSNGSHSTKSNHNHGPQPPTTTAPPPPAPLTPKSLPRSDATPYPTTFVQADASSFKKVVQMLTGSSETTTKHSTPRSEPPPPSRSPIPAAKTGPKRPAFKLYERRHSNSFKSLKINPLVPGLFNPNPTSSPNSPITATGFSPRYKPEVLSPSVLEFPSLTLSPVTTLIPDSSFSPGAGAGFTSAEERAIAEKGFYLHPSPRSADPPRLLPLFPVTSPRLAASGGDSSI